MIETRNVSQLKCNESKCGTVVGILKIKKKLVTTNVIVLL